ncbi:hypothetical protein M0L20_00470 [Spirosoma sp. RP8]|uniref:Aromatic hydrocarbon degradation protein n=1 Tax=Spirosoma liriopis TaxID=2937440 RepID=A0ABT0HE76_9BACT|nr:hypothetical protein [Spirosoma liriopis]MCK8490300.1 hypothetical protein [Spirosoma liriopis]
MNTKFFLSAFFLGCTGLAFGQGPAADYADDAFRFSDFSQSGTARFRALGGNHTALGGDASNLSGNPAGLAFYNRSELNISPSFNLVNNQNSFLGGQTNSNGGKLNIGQLGVILAGSSNNSRRWRRTAFGIGYSQSTNFYDKIDARGINRNTGSSLAQTYANNATAGNYSEAELSDDYDPASNTVSFTEAGAYGLFLINPTDLGTNGSGPPYTALGRDATRAKDQRATLNRSGTHSQWSLSYAGNLDDKLYIGGSIALTRLRYSSEYIFLETPVNGVDIANYSQTNRFDVTGNGFTATLGLIYKIIPDLQIGATIMTPTFSSAREVFSQSLAVNLAPGSAISLRRPNQVNVTSPYDNFDYSLQTPLRASGGATYFIGKGKIGFITASAEYVGYGGLRVRTSYFNSQQDNTDFKNDVRQVVQSSYQNVLNLRAGAEIRAGLLRLRAGVGYLPSAYKLDLDRVARADRDKLLLSAGLGVRNDRFFADLSGSYLTYNTGFTTYQLSNSADTPTVATSNRNTNVMLSFGVFF